MITQLVWSTEQRQVKNLLPFKKNPRRMSDKQIADLTQSLEKFGLVEIPAIDTDNKIVAGHQRIAVLQLLGRGDETIDVRVPNRKLSKSEYEQYLLTSNRVHSDWDYEILSEYFDLDTMLISGFDDSDLSVVFADSLETEDDGFNTDEELKKIQKPTVKPGEFFKLGDHTLGCIDSTDEILVRKLVGKNKIDFVDVDPPFNIKYSYQGKNNKYGGQEKDDRSLVDYKSFITALIRNSIAVSKPDAHYIFWCDERWVFLLQQLYQDLGITSQRLCIWVKDNAMPTVQIAFNKVTEFACYGTIGSPYLNDKVKNINTIMNKEVGTGQRLVDDILDLFNIWLVKRLPGNSYIHPTEKPVTLHEKALRRCTRVGDSVLDLTAGSGSLMVACEQLKRRAFLAEADPLFATLIIKKYEKLTGKKAKKLN